jgi:L-glutamine-phosphate cytidylyltransferase
MRKLSPYSGPAEGDGPSIRTALLLAAGIGSRLAPLTDTMPKCLVSVAGMPILERLVRALDAHGIERLVIVVGYRAGMIRDYLGESFGGITVEYIEDSLFATTSTLYSLWLARQAIDEPFLIIESDVVFDTPLLAPLLQGDRIAVSAQLPWMNGTTVTLDSHRRVTALYSSAPGVYDQHCRDTDHFITVNITSVARDTWTEVRKGLDRHVAAGHTGIFHDVVFAEMTAAGTMALEAVIFPTERWYEVDTPADRDAAESIFPSRLPAAGGSGRLVRHAGKTH